MAHRNTRPDERPHEAPDYSAFGLMRLIEESALPSELKQLATTYIRLASSRPKDGHPAGYGYTGQARLADAQGIKPRALRLRLKRFDALADAGVSPIRIRRGFRARHGEGNRGGRSSDWYQIELVEGYVPPDRSGSGVPDGSTTEAVVEYLMGPTEAAAECRLAPDRSGSPLPMICGALICQDEGSAQREKSAAPSGAPGAGAPDPSARREEEQPPASPPSQGALAASVESLRAAMGAEVPANANDAERALRRLRHSCHIWLRKGATDDDETWRAYLADRERSGEACLTREQFADAVRERARQSFAFDWLWARKDGPRDFAACAEATAAAGHGALSDEEFASAHFGVTDLKREKAEAAKRRVESDHAANDD